MKLSFTHYILKSVCFLLFFSLLSSTNLNAASIGDWVWADANNNGLLEGGEGGIGDVIIELFDNEGTLINTAESNHDGYYTFNGLSAGTYTVAVVESSLIAPLTTPGSYTVTLTENETYLTADFGLLTSFSTNNKPPVIITKNACTAPQVPVTVCLEIFEPEGDDTNITEGTTQTGAGFTILNDDCFRYTPLPGYEGIDTVFVTVCDDANPTGCTIGKIAVSVPCPGGPLAVNDSLTTTQSTPIIIEVLANDNGQAPLEVTNVEDAPNGTTQLINNVVLYTPDAGFIGIDSFTYSMTDASNQTSSATVYITVTGMPVDCELEMMQCIEIDTPMVICPEYCEVEGSSLNVIEIASTAGGQMIGSTTEIGCYKYIPPAGFAGSDIITILACNVEDNCAQTIINIQVTASCDGGGDDIVAQDDFAVAIENTFITLNVLGNDFDPQGDDFSIQNFSQAANGTVTDQGGLLQYTPNANFVGTDSFTYTICDINGNCDDATVTIDVISDGQGCTDAVEVCDNATTPTEICIEFCTVNDAMIVGLTSIFEATLNINNATCFGYTPPSGFAGTDEVEVVGCNELGVCDTVLVTVGVQCPAPIANNDAGGTMVGQPLNLNVLENDAQTCDYTLSATLTGEAQMGEAILSSNGDLSYTPNEGATGQDTFTYMACNNCAESLCDTATITIVIGDDSNQAPIAVDDEGITLPNTPLDIFILANDSDPDGDNISVTATTPPANGTVTINPDTQAATYTPNTDFEGTDSFTYQICDDGEPVLCSTATVTITVGDVGVNNPPIAVDDAIVTQINQLIGVGVLGNDSDPDGDALTITAISNAPANGTAEIVGFNNSAINYTPNNNFIGTDTFEYVVCDPLGLCDTAQVIVTVINPDSNAPPVAMDDNASTETNTPINIDVLANDVDANGDNLSISTISTNPSNGTVTIDNGIVTYTPNTDFNGTDTFEYVVCDPDGLCDTALVTIIVSEAGENLPPTAIDDNATTEVNTPINIEVLANDTDPNGDNLVISTISTNPSNGTVTIDNGIVTYTPNTDFIGEDNFEYVVCDPEGLCDTALVTVTVNEAGENQAPIAVDDNATVASNTPLTIDVLANDTDPDGDNLTISNISTNPSNGTVTIDNGVVIYTPNTDFIGEDSFEYVVCDAGGLCDTALVTVNVVDPGNNQPPVAVDDAITTQINQLIGIGVLGNDSDPDGDALTITVISSNPSNGTAEIVGFNNSSINYTPNNNFVGTDTFEYVVCDPLGFCDTAQVVVNVINPGGNQPPIAIDDNATTGTNTLVSIDVLANDVDADGDDLTVTEINTAPTNGTVTIEADGTVSYTPNTDFTGTDSFEYTVCDPEGLCDVGLVVITVNENGNQAPIAVDDNVMTQINELIGIGVLANDSDPDGDNLTVTTISNSPANGTVEIIGNSSVNYTPNDDFVGIDSFDYVICDAAGLCDTATVTVTVVDPNINQAPIAVDDEATTETNTPISIEVLANDSDPDGDTLTITDINDLPSNGTVSIDGDAVIYTPNTDFIGVDSFEYVVCDTEGLCDTALVVVTITEELPNQAPIAVDDEATTETNTPISIEVLANDSDPDGDTLTITDINDLPSNGTVSIDGDAVIYTPNTDFIGVDSFEYVVCDTEGLCDTALIVVTVTEEIPNQAPIAVDDEATTETNTPISIEVLTNDSDPDGDILTITDINDLPSNGTVSIDGDAVIYTPNTDFIGVDSFEYVVCDTEGLCDTALVVVRIVDELPNQAPIAVDDEATIEVNTGLAVDVLDNDSDPDGDQIVLTSITVSPQNGTAGFNIDSSAIVYTPNTDFIGTDSFEYVICDTEGLCDTALVVITVEDEGENQPPIAVDDEATTTPNTQIDIPILDNDSDPDGDEIVLTSITVFPQNGTAEFNTDSSGILYTPNEDFEGMDTLEYVICDSDGLCDTALVVITIVESPFPIIADTTDEDTPLTVCVEEFLETINFPIDSMTIFTLPENGTVLINDASILSDSCFVYTPAENFNGNDDFLLGICNVAENTCDTITVNITVLPVNDAPTAVDDLTNTDVNTSIVIPVLDNDFDIDGDSLAVVTIEIAPSNGEAIINPDGTVTYTPDEDFVGIDTFEYVISDPEGLTDTARVFIGIGEAIGIIAVDDSTSTPVDTPIDIPVLDNDLFGDFPTDSTVITISSNPSNGIVGVNGDGIKDTSITYNPLPDFVGTDTFEYVVCIAALCDTATVIVTVTEEDTGCEIFIPNAFSPNRDGVNDELMIPNLGACFPTNELIIFNRWGDEIFRRQNYDDLDDPWDGTWQKNKEDVPDGTYFYILTGQDEEGVALEPRSGFIEICR